MKRICIVVCIMLLWAALSLQAGAVSVRTASVEAIGAEEEEDEDAEAKIYWEEIDNRITAQDFIYDKLQKHVERFSFHYGGYDSFSMYDALHYNLSSENDYIKWNIEHLFVFREMNTTHTYLTKCWLAISQFYPVLCKRL